MTITPPTYDDFLASMNRVIEQRGEDFNYVQAYNDGQPDSCYYVVNGQPACIAGAIFADLGKTADEIADYEGNPASDVAASLFNTVLDSKTIRLLNDAQMMQDGGETWGRARAYATGELTDDDLYDK